jgi:hypothetical protein
LSADGREKETIVWSPEVTLKADDFRADVPQNAEFDARSWTGIDFNGNCLAGQFAFEVYAIFHRDSSWIKPHRAIREVLHHEKLHFDIAEIYARRLRSAFADISRPCEDLQDTRSRIDSILQVNELALAQEQQKFDRETRHGTNAVKQLQWENNIKLRLEKLSQYIDNPFP